MDLGMKLCFKILLLSELMIRYYQGMCPGLATPKLNIIDKGSLGSLCISGISITDGEC